MGICDDDEFIGISHPLRDLLERSSAKVQTRQRNVLCGSELPDLYAF
jgi:hypothetical protein